jgi:hypothetical protein
LSEFELSRQIFEKYSNIKFRKIHPAGNELFHAGGRTDRQTDRHDEANSRFSQFCERAQKIQQGITFGFQFIISETT